MVLRISFASAAQPGIGGWGTYRGPQRRDGWPPGMRARCRPRPRIRRRTAPRSGGTQPYGSGTADPHTSGSVSTCPAYPRTNRVGRVRTSTKFDWYFWSRGATSRCTSPLRRTYIPHPGISDIPPRARKPRERRRTFSSSSYGTYHLERRVLPWRFCGMRAPSGCCRAIRSLSGTDLDEDEANHGWRIRRGGTSRRGYIGDGIHRTETRCVADLA